MSLTGNEHVLDIGCGRGAVLIMAARRLPHGSAVGVDLWRTKDQSGNAREVTERNADLEGVRVELSTADMTSLPFGDNTFDVVLSNLAIHNVNTDDGRAQAVREAVRVLRPGGRLVVADIFHTAEYVKTLKLLPVSDISRRSLGWRMWWGGPWIATRLVTAVKR